MEPKMLLYYDELDKDQIQDLENAGVIMDDWDFVLLVPVDMLQSREDDIDFCNNGDLEPVDYTLEAWFTRHSFYTCYKIELWGELRGVCVTYHA